MSLHKITAGDGYEYLTSIFHRAVSGRCDGLRITAWD